MNPTTHHTPHSRPAAAILALTLVSGAALAAAELRPKAIVGWQAYVTATEHRRRTEAGDPGRFLALDFTETAARDRRRLMQGDPVITRVDEEGRGQPGVDVRSAMVHHWRGAILVRDISLEALIAHLRGSPGLHDDVLRAAVLDRSPDSMRVYLRLRRSRFMTVVYDTEHLVTFESVGRDRAATASVATRIVEIANPGTPDEHPLPGGEDHGFLWRLNAYWRYQAVAGGVIAECESLVLSRSVPFGLRLIAQPIINGTGENSMRNALETVAALGGAAAESLRTDLHIGVARGDLALSPKGP